MSGAQSTTPITSLYSFLWAARRNHQREILKTFLFKVIMENTVSESGSIHIYDEAAELLRLFNHDNFLQRQGFLKVPEKGQYQETFKRWEGVAGTVFASKELIHVPDVDKDSRYSVKKGKVPIRAMVCAPIMADADEPFGVVSFHNDEVSEQFDAPKIDLIRTYAAALGIALSASRVPWNQEANRNVFLVHGHASQELESLKSLLGKHGLEPVVLKEQPTQAGEMLNELHDAVARCTAAFVLMTPDDEGAKQGTAMQPRARQNVVLESGYLLARFAETGRVCFLVQRPIEIPSDLGGLRYTTMIESVDSAKSEIEATLEKWKLIEERPQFHR